MTLWQGLGGWVATARNLGTHHLDKLAEIGGKWVCVVIYNDSTATENITMLPTLKSQCRARGMTVLGWYNGFGGDPEEDAKAISKIHYSLDLNGIILDLERAYQYPAGDANLMPILVKALRTLVPKPAEIAVSTNGMNSSMIWNGRTLAPPQSFYDLGIRVMPQWYSSPNYSGCWTDPVCNMKWLKENGHKDFNFKDPNAPKTKYRGVPLSYVHPTVEGTGIENASLEQSLELCRQAKVYGLTPGISYYLLERCSDEDFSLMAKYKGVLYLA